MTELSSHDSLIQIKSNSLASNSANNVTSLDGDFMDRALLSRTLIGDEVGEVWRSVGSRRRRRRSGFGGGLRDALGGSLDLACPV